MGALYLLLVDNVADLQCAFLLINVCTANSLVPSCAFLWTL